MPRTDDGPRTHLEFRLELFELFLQLGANIRHYERPEQAFLCMCLCVGRSGASSAKRRERSKTVFAAGRVGDVAGSLRTSRESWRRRGGVQTRPRRLSKYLSTQAVFCFVFQDLFGIDSLLTWSPVHTTRDRRSILLVLGRVVRGIGGEIIG